MVRALRLITPLDEIEKDIPGAIWKLQTENKELRIRIEGLEKQIQVICELFGKLDELMSINTDIASAHAQYETLKNLREIMNTHTDVASTNAQYETLKNLRKILFGGKK